LKDKKDEKVKEKLKLVFIDDMDEFKEKYL